MIQIALPSPRRKARIEIIPLIDIIFFLLATFVLVSLSMVKNQGVPIRLPIAATSKAMDPGESLILRIAADGTIGLDHREISIEALPAFLNTYQKAHNDPKVIIQGDADVAYGKVVAVLDRVRQAGISKVAVQTTNKKAP